MKKKCVLASGHSASYIARLRKKVFEETRGGRPKPHGFKLIAICGNQRCIEFDHLRLQPWASWRTKREGKSGEGRRPKNPGVSGSI